MCASTAPGHLLHPIRRAAAAATASSWVDTIVVAANQDGRLELASVFSDERYTVWNHGDVSALAVQGDVAAYNPTYGVVALGLEWLCVGAPGQAL